MSTLFVDAINEKTSGNGVQIPGHVVQVKYRTIQNAGISTTSTSFTDCTNIYVDITPESSSNLIVWQCTQTFNLNDENGYARFRIVDSNNSDAAWSSNTYMASASYYLSTAAYLDYPFFHTNTAGSTNGMRLQLQVLIESGGTLTNNWSTLDARTIMAMEIAQ